MFDEYYSVKEIFLCTIIYYNIIKGSIIILIQAKNTCNELLQVA